MKGKKRSTAKLMRKAIGSLYKRKENPAVSIYLECIPLIDRLLRQGKLGINLKERHVVMDVSLHLLFCDDDKKYISFFDKISAYINFTLGMMKKEEFQSPDERITFEVQNRELRFVDDNGDPVPESEREQYRTFIIGYCEAGHLEYKTC